MHCPPCYIPVLLPTTKLAQHNFEEIQALSPSSISFWLCPRCQSSKVSFSCWQGLRAGFHLSRLIYTVPRAEPCFTISRKSSKAKVFTPTPRLWLCAPGEGGTAQNRSVQRPATPPPILCNAPHTALCSSCPQPPPLGHQALQCPCLQPESSWRLFPSISQEMLS